MFRSYGGLRGVHERPFPTLGLRVEHAFDAWVVVVGCGLVHSRQFVLPSSLIEPRHGLGNVLRAFLALCQHESSIAFGASNDLSGIVALLHGIVKFLPRWLLGISSVSLGIGFPEFFKAIRRTRFFTRPFNSSLPFPSLPFPTVFNMCARVCTCAHVHFIAWFR